MKTETQKMLPKTASEITNGGVYVQSVRCGKSNCKCSRGDTHSAFYFFTRRNGKLIKIYVRKAEVEAFSLIVKNASKERKELRQTSRLNLEQLREFRQVLRERQAFINSLKEI